MGSLLKYVCISADFPLRCIANDRRYIAKIESSDGPPVVRVDEAFSMEPTAYPSREADLTRSDYLSNLKMDREADLTNSEFIYGS
jgi:hypothetical protein